MTNPSKLPKIYDPSQFEKTIYQKWEMSGALRTQTKGESPWMVVMPPPNVTGKLHMGHALNMTLQDVLVRFQRMRGYDVLWQAGTDHAGIATQAVVEKILASESNQTRSEIGRDEFLKRAWAFKEQSGNNILLQLRRLGASCDWERARFTLDEDQSIAVYDAFVQLYEDGLIYSDKRLVNWDVKLRTAISDLEVVQREVEGHLWHVRYALEDGTGEIIVATTRPETMLGDSAVAVHPDDGRYQHAKGKRVRLPLSDRLIPIIADDYADPKQGSGAVKITPAHDFNDFEVGKRHGIEMINIFDERGCIVDEAFVPRLYRGLSREAAREQIVSDLEKAGLIAKIEEHRHAIPYGDRSDSVIEPRLSDQYYLDAKKLARAAIDAVRLGETQFVPKNWEKIYFDWLENIQPWCISRQLWWGHRIPIWYDEQGKAYAARDEAAAQTQAGAKAKLTQDEDVLDTWFSSALWPFSTLGWPDKSRDLAHYFPTQVLITGFDIIFFWVARMMMMSCYFMKQAPFETVYIHALVRDEHGQKMTKSRGNVVDPLVLMDRYGADALRFTLIAMAAQGRDVRLSEARIVGYRNFATKLWNAARFCQIYQCEVKADFDPEKLQQDINQWIVARLTQSVAETIKAFEQYHFNMTVSHAYQFVWHEFCDWYLEFAKPILMGEKNAMQAETQQTAAWVLEQILRLLHPFMPFITEELWGSLRQGQGLLLVQPFASDAVRIDDYQQSTNDIENLIELISHIRALRSLLKVPAATYVQAFVSAGAGQFERFAVYLYRLARVELVQATGDARGFEIALKEARVHLLLESVIDIQVVAFDLGLIEAQTQLELKELEEKLSNRQFTDNAPAQVVEENRARLVELKASHARLEAVLAQLADIF